MAFDYAPTLVGMKAAADLSAKQYFCMKQTAADTVGICAAETDRTFGILYDAPAAVGRSATVAVDGIAKVCSDGSGVAIAVGDQLAVDTNGRAVKCTTADRLLVGEAMEASSAQGTIIAVRLRIGVPYRTPG